jgi:hypothetical protein
MALESPYNQLFAVFRALFGYSAFRLRALLAGMTARKQMLRAQNEESPEASGA